MLAMTDVQQHLRARGKHRWRLWYAQRGNANPRCFVADRKRWPKGQRLAVHPNTYHALMRRDALQYVESMSYPGALYYVYAAATT